MASSRVSRRSRNETARLKRRTSSASAAGSRETMRRTSSAIASTFRGGTAASTLNARPTCPESAARPGKISGGDAEPPRARRGPDSLQRIGIEKPMTARRGARPYSLFRRGSHDTGNRDGGKPAIEPGWGSGLPWALRRELQGKGGRGGEAAPPRRRFPLSCAETVAAGGTARARLRSEDPVGRSEEN